MSKLTNWLDNDELDIQGIVDKYEQDLINNQKANNLQKTHNLQPTEDAIWSESIDDDQYLKLSSVSNSNEHQKTVNLNNNDDLKPKYNSNKTINFNLNDEHTLFNNKEKISSNKTINFGLLNDNNKTLKRTDEELKINIESSPLSKKEEGSNLKFNKSTIVPPPPPIRKVETEKAKTILFNDFKTTNHQSIPEIEIVDTKKVQTKILDNDKANKFKTNTIVFKNNTNELSKNKQNSSLFDDNETFLKNLNSQNYKTVKFQSLEDDGISIDAKPIKTKKATNLETSTTSKFENSLTNIFFNETQKAESLDLTKEINQAEAFDFEIKKNKKKEKNSLKAEEKNKFKNNVPNFIKNECRFLLTNIILATIYFLGTIALIGYITYIYLNQNGSIYLMIPAGILSVLGIYFIFVNWYRYRKLHQEVKQCNYEINKELPLISLKKIYKRLLIANINLNWASLLIYSLCGLGILLTFIVNYFVNLINFQVNDFNNLYYNNDPSPLIAVWTQAAIVFALIPFQIIFNIINKRRMDSMNLYYQKEIINDELALKYQKDARKKWKIIYITIITLVGLIVLITYLVLRRKSKK